MTLAVGDAAPALTARNQDREPVSPAFDEPTVVYFYPRDGTSGCTTEAEQFQVEHPTYRDAGVEVYGVSTDDVDAHAAFAADLGLSYDLLSDADGRLAAAFGVEVTNDRADRVTFVVADGEVVSVYRDVRPDGHARRVLADLLDAGLVSIDD